MSKRSLSLRRAHPALLTLLAPAVWIGACSEAYQADCGVDAVVISEQGSSYCVYRREAVVIEGGFSCPASMRHRADYDELVVCSDSELSGDEPPQVICAMLDRGCESAPPQLGAAAPAPTDPEPPIASGGMPWPSPFERPVVDYGDGPPSGASWEPDVAPTCDAALAEFHERCPNLPELFVSAEGREDGDGTAADPISDLRTAFERCEPAGCHLRITGGSYETSERELTVQGCMHIEGAFRIADDGAWIADGGRTTLELPSYGIQPFPAVPNAPTTVLIDRVRLRASYSVLNSVPGLLVVRNSVIAGGHNGIEVHRSSQQRSHVRVCDTDITADYAGIGLSWGASDVVLERVRAEAGYEALGVSWGSWGVIARDCELTGDYVAVNASWDSHHITVERSVLSGGEGGLIDFTDSHDVRIADNTVFNGELPASMPERNIEVTGNSYGDR